MLKMIQLFVLIGFSAIVSAKPFPRFEGKIVGGEIINITEAPHQVSLFSRGRFLCGGTIISEDYVLTAAHCSQYTSYSIRAGSSFTNEGGSVHTITETIIHEKYGITASKLPRNDIALMKVSPPFKLDETRVAIRLVEKDTTLTVGAYGMISGWGSTKEGGFGSYKLRAVQVPIISLKSCKEQYAYLGLIPDGQICAAYPEGGKDSCQGDSGGPFVVGGRLAGVVSWGYGCARPSNPGVYTEVAYFRDWIGENSGL